MRLKTIVLFVCVAITQLFSQTGNLLGTVSDSNGSFPLPGANVYLEGTNFGGITDSGGKVYLSNLPVGNYKLVVSYIGYENQEKDISIDAESLNTFSLELSVGTLVGNDIDVIGNSLSGQARALNNQKNKSNISNVISSDQVGKFPDSNIGDALKRVPGIAVYNDMGEARFGHVRGTPSSFNSATINGERMPSAEATTRSNQLDLIPADMIQTVEVIKALTPDMDADAIGGSINLITRKAAGKRSSITVGRGNNSLDEAGKIVQLSGMYSDRPEGKNFGYMFNFSFYDNWTGSDNIEAEWDDEGNIVEHDIRKYLVHRERKSLGLRFDYNLGNSEVYADLNFNDRDDYENRYRQRIKDLDEGEGSQEIRRQTKAGLPGNEYGRLEDQKLFSYKFGGTSFLDKLKLDYSFKISEASELRPNERYLALRLKKQTAVWNGSTNKPNFSFSDPIASDLNDSWDFREIIEERRDTDEKARSFKIDADYSFTDNLKLEAGLKISTRKKERRNEFYEFEPVDEDAFLADAFSNIVNQNKSEWLNDGNGTSFSPGSFVSREFLGNLDLSNTELFDRVIVEEELAGNFKASEDITSFYGMASYDYSDQLLVVGGIRLERTSLYDLEARSYNEDNDQNNIITAADSDYTDVLPSLHLIYDLDGASKIRVALTKSLARPNYFDTVPYQQVKVEDEEIKVGNPELEPTISTNFDISFERYYDDVGLFSAGIFTKDIDNFVVYTSGYVTQADNLPDYDGFQLEKALNGGNASLLGVEIAFQRQILPGLGLYANVTAIDSKIDNLDPKLQEDRPDVKDNSMPGTSELSYNLSMSYERGPTTVRLSLNHQGEFLEEFGDSKSEDRWYDKATYVDLNANYNLRENISIYADFNNLTNQPLRYYQGSSRYMMQEEYYNRKFTLGIKADL